MRGLVLFAAAAAVCLPGQAVENINVEEVIKKFAAKEAEFAQARSNYTYRQSVKMEELDPGGNPTGGKWEEVADIIFSPDGKRSERVVYAPVVNLRQIQLTPDDVADLRSVQPFVLTTTEIPDYDIRYLGPEKVDEIGCYTFAVKPKKMVKGKRYFEGQIWVDDQDLQIVKTYGKGVGLVNKETNQFPKFETYREQIDKKYWFPTYTRADDVLHFKEFNQRIRMTVKYQDYRKFEGRSTIKFGDVVEDPKTPPTPPAPPAAPKKN